MGRCALTVAGVARTLLLSLLTCAIACGMATGARVQRPIRAMWVRGEQVPLSPRSGDALLDLCASRRIELLFVAVPELMPGSYEKWRRFLTHAHQRGVRVHALAGEARWGLVQGTAEASKKPQRGPMLAAGRSLALNHIGQVIAYNRSAGPTERFDGVQHDVPVWDTERYASAGDSPARATILANYVEQLWGCAQFLRSLGEQVLFGTRIPVGLDDAVTWGKPGQYKEATLPLSQQVIRTAHYVAIMAAADTTDGVLAAVADDVQFAGNVGTRAFVGVSTAPVGTTGSGATFADNGLAAMDQVLAEVTTRLATEPGFAGIAIDSYATYESLRP